MDTVDGDIQQFRNLYNILEDEIVGNLQPMFPHFTVEAIRESVIHQSKCLIDPLDQTRLTNNCIDELLEPKTSTTVTEQTIPGDYIDLTQDSTIRSKSASSNGVSFDVSPDVFESNSIINLDESTDDIFDSVDVNQNIKNKPTTDLHLNNSNYLPNADTVSTEGLPTSTDTQAPCINLTEVESSSNSESLRTGDKGSSESNLLPFEVQNLPPKGSGIPPESSSTSAGIERIRSKIRLFQALKRGDKVADNPKDGFVMGERHHHSISSKAPSTMSICPCDDCKSNPSPRTEHHLEGHHSADGPLRHSSLIQGAGFTSDTSTCISSTVQVSGGLDSTDSNHPFDSNLEIWNTGARDSTSTICASPGSKVTAHVLMNLPGTSSFKEKPLDSGTPTRQDAILGDDGNSDIMRARLDSVDAALLRLTKMCKSPRPSASNVSSPATAIANKPPRPSNLLAFTTTPRPDDSEAKSSATHSYQASATSAPNSTSHYQYAATVSNQTCIQRLYKKPSSGSQLPASPSLTTTPFKLNTPPDKAPNQRPSVQPALGMPQANNWTPTLGALPKSQTAGLVNRPTLPAAQCMGTSSLHKLSALALQQPVTPSGPTHLQALHLDDQKMILGPCTLQVTKKNIPTPHVSNPLLKPVVQPVTTPTQMLTENTSTNSVYKPGTNSTTSATGFVRIQQPLLPNQGSNRQQAGQRNAPTAPLPKHQQQPVMQRVESVAAAPRPYMYVPKPQPQPVRYPAANPAPPAIKHFPGQGAIPPQPVQRYQYLPPVPPPSLSNPLPPPVIHPVANPAPPAILQLPGQGTIPQQPQRRYLPPVPPPTLSNPLPPPVIHPVANPAPPAILQLPGQGTIPQQPQRRYLPPVPPPTLSNPLPPPVIHPVANPAPPAILQLPGQGTISQQPQRRYLPPVPPPSLSNPLPPPVIHPVANPAPPAILQLPGQGTISQQPERRYLPPVPPPSLSNPLPPPVIHPVANPAPPAILQLPGQGAIPPQPERRYLPPVPPPSLSNPLPPPVIHPVANPAPPTPAVIQLQPPEQQPGQGNGLGNGGKNTEQMKVEILMLFPDADPSYILTRLEAFRDYPSPTNEVCNHLLENPTYPRAKKQEAPPKPVQKKTCQVDFIKDYYKLRASSNFMSTVIQLQNDFRMLAVETIRTMLTLHYRHYAPTRLCLEEIICSNETVHNRLQRVKQCTYDQRKIKVEITTKDSQGKEMKTKVIIHILKGRRNLLHQTSYPVSDLQEEMECYKDHVKNSAVEKDLLLALSMNENEYEAEGQLIECGCCYAEVTFEKMIQCLDGHLFCESCLQMYAQQAVYGQGKAQLMCMTDGCDSSYPRDQLEKCLTVKDMSKYDERVQEESIQLASMDGLVRCPHCDFAAVLDPGDKVFSCQNTDCRKETCRHCGEDWMDHFGKRCEEIEKKSETNMRTSYEERMSQAQIRTCNRCKTGIMKDQGCNKMTCRCGAKMCYICRRPNIEYTHFCAHARNPGQGCTTCTKCSLWTDPAEDDARAVKELEKDLQLEQEKIAKATDSRDRLGPPELAPGAKKQRVF